VKVQKACRLMLSRAVHTTLVGPSGNAPPEPGVHETATGGVPPAIAGAGNVTAISVPVTPSTVASAGQVSAGAAGVSAGGGVGAAGLLLQPVDRPIRIAMPIATRAGR
jgi:hypothetical protein